MYRYVVMSVDFAFDPVVVADRPHRPLVGRDHAQKALEAHHADIGDGADGGEKAGVGGGGYGMGVAVTLAEEPHQQRYQDLLASLSNTLP